jgi:hypothetical protein
MSSRVANQIAAYAIVYEYDSTNYNYIVDSKILQKYAARYFPYQSHDISAHNMVLK